MKKIKMYSLLIILCALVMPQLTFAAIPITPPVAETTISEVQENEEAAAPKAKKSKKAAPAGKSQIVALLLCLFVGWLGVHRFYLGYTWQGVVQLLTAGVFGIWTLIDLIRIIIGDLQPKNGSYDKTL